ncbi:hypothetical protein JZ751_025886 [Albula glossodonta]|uniref:tRNA pseudouridine(55) synthase n=1 Tax=Albula glossodonta TaxID=121402 RepID=A0A8T2NGA4_9TELE|nr:hypothetical protein JZ751_025886 [Albula glossodonta]
MGHGGTLDSPASGVLVVGIGNGTKMLSSMLTGSKKYTAIGELGKATDTLDATGSVIEEKAYDHITREKLEEKLQKFVGDIMQVPPLYSALKKDGQRLLVLLRQGQKVEAKPARPVKVYSLSILSVAEDFMSGVWWTTLEKLASCAHVKELVRTKQGQFTLDDHALREEKWTIDDIALSLQTCNDQSDPTAATDMCAPAEQQGHLSDHEDKQKET